jgi:hypothetical protein
MTGRILCRLALTLLCVAWARPAEPSCAIPGPLCQSWRTYDAIFDGTVRAIDRADRDDSSAGQKQTIGHRLVTFEVHESWRGAVGERVQLFLAGGYGTRFIHGFDVKIGTRYVIFANRLTSGELSTSSCSDSREYTDAGPALAFLRSLRQPGPGGRIFGAFLLLSPSSRHGTHQPGPIGASLRITGSGFDRTIPAQDLKFEIGGLQPGTYVVAATVPDHMTVDYASQVAVLPDAHACYHASFPTRHSTAVTGRIVDVDGKPAARRRVEAADAANWQRDPMSPINTYTNSDGRFELTGLAPGAYVVGLNLRDTPAGSEPQGRVMFPTAGSDPAPVHLAPGERLALGTLRLGPALPEVPLALRLTWEGGLPIANHAVSLEDVTGGHSPNRSRPIANTRTETGGIVRVSGRGTRTYIVRVWTHGRGGPTEVGRSAPFTAESAAKGLTLVIEPIR